MSLIRKAAKIMSTTPPTIQPQTGIVWYQGVSSGISSIGFIASMPSSEGIEKEIAVVVKGSRISVTCMFASS